MSCCKKNVNGNVFIEELEVETLVVEDLTVNNLTGSLSVTELTIDGGVTSCLLFGDGQEKICADGENIRIFGQGNEAMLINDGLTIIKSTSGFAVDVSNTSEVPQMLIKNSGTGDSGVLMLNNSGGEWTFGLDQSDSNKFKIENDIALSSSAQFTIATDGNVGIGTADPTAPLHIFRNDSFSSLLTLDQNGAGDAGLFLQAGSGSFQVAVDNSDDDAFVISSAGVGVNNFMRCDRVSGDVEFSLANVGIGTATPATNLHVYENNSSNIQMRLENGGIGDATMRFDITGQTWAAGIDNSDGDKFKITNGTSLGVTSNLVIDTAGFMGIGTSTPLTRAHIYDDSGFASILSLEQDGLGDCAMVYNITGEQLWVEGVDNDDFNRFKIHSNSTFPSPTEAPDFFIKTTGDVGIGVSQTDSAALLTVGGDITISRGAEVSSLTSKLSIKGARSASGNSYASIDFDNLDEDGNDVNYTGARIQSQNDTGADTGDLRFSTNDGSLTQRMIIDSDGMVTITQNNALETPQLILENDGSGDTALKFSIGSTNTDNIIMGQNNSISGDPFVMGIGDTVGASGPFFGYHPVNNYVSVVSSVYNHSFRVGVDDAAKPSTSTWTVISDERWKENIEDKSLIECCDLIKNLRLRTFTYNDAFVEENKVENNEPRIGLIAQEVQATVIETMNKDDDRIVREVGGGPPGLENYLTLNPDQINYQLLGAVQCLLAKLN
jgi:hypothetical protein